MVHITRAIEKHKNTKTVSHSPVLVYKHRQHCGAKHWNSAPPITAFSYHQTGIRQWEKNEDILTEVNGKKWMGCSAAHKSTSVVLIKVSNVFCKIF